VVELSIRNRAVVGSSPTGGSERRKDVEKTASRENVKKNPQKKNVKKNVERKSFLAAELGQIAAAHISCAVRRPQSKTDNFLHCSPRRDSFMRWLGVPRARTHWTPFIEEALLFPGGLC
jgi:hypothetical protein